MKKARALVVILLILIWFIVLSVITVTALQSNEANVQVQHFEELRYEMITEAKQVQTLAQVFSMNKLDSLKYDKDVLEVRLKENLHGVNAEVAVDVSYQVAGEKVEFLEFKTSSGYEEFIQVNSIIILLSFMLGLLVTYGTFKEYKRVKEKS